MCVVGLRQQHLGLFYSRKKLASDVKDSRLRKKFYFLVMCANASDNIAFRRFCGIFTLPISINFGQRIVIGGLYASVSWWEGVGQARLLIAPVLVISSFLHHWIPWPRISFTNCSKYYSKVNIDIL